MPADRVSTCALVSYYCLEVECQRKILDVTYTDHVRNVRNEEILFRSGSRKLSGIVTEPRFCLAGHVLHPARAALIWTRVDVKRKIGRPKMTWRKTLEQDLARVNMSREEVVDVAMKSCCAMCRNAWKELSLSTYLHIKVRILPV